MQEFFQIWKQVFLGKTVMRSMMNLEVAKLNLHGAIADIGGGVHPSYYKFLKDSKNLNISSIDFESANYKLDLEISTLPFSDNFFDGVFLFNVLEHIFDYNHVLVEANRILKDGGQVVGFVPFLINYHPDPHDYWRFTNESLTKVFLKIGFDNIKIQTIGRGPILVNFNHLASWLPKFLLFILFPFYYLLDYLLLYFRPKFKLRYPLGFFFLMNKK